MSTWHWVLYIIVVSSSLGLHELGHWTAMSRFKIPLAKATLGLGPSFRLIGRLHIALFPLGASVSPDPEAWKAAKPNERFQVALAGPMASFIAGGLLLALSFLHPNAAKGLAAFATLHFAIGAFNLLPIPPLDGWHVLTELMASKGRALPARATAIASRLGNGMVYGFGFWFIGSVLTGRY